MENRSNSYATATAKPVNKPGSNVRGATIKPTPDMNRLIESPSKVRQFYNRTQTVEDSSPVINTTGGATVLPKNNIKAN